MSDGKEGRKDGGKGEGVMDRERNNGIISERASWMHYKHIS